MRLYQRKSVLLLSVVSICLLMLFSGCAQSKAEVPKPAPFDLPETTVPYTVQEMPITIEDRYIYGKAYLPQDGNKTHPTVNSGARDGRQPFPCRSVLHAVCRARYCRVCL